MRENYMSIIDKIDSTHLASISVWHAPEEKGHIMADQWRMRGETITTEPFTFLNKPWLYIYRHARKDS